MLQLALLAQCITSIWLFAWRAQHGSDALYDHRILQLAILGLATSTMSILHIVLRPRYPSLQSWHGCHAKVRRLASLRRQSSQSEDSEPVEILVFKPTYNYMELYRIQDLSDLSHLLIDWTYAYTTLSIAQALGLELESFLTYTELWYLVEVSASYTYYYLFFSALVAVQFRKILFHQPRTTFKWIAFAFTALVFVAVAVPLVVWATGLSFTIFLKPIQSGYQIRTLLSTPSNYENCYATYYNYETNSTKAEFIKSSFFYDDYYTIHPDWSRIWTYGHKPASCPCPQAWKDPAADYVWWLA